MTVGKTRHKCTECPLGEDPSVCMVPGSGDPESDIWVVGEAPGEEENESGIPFIGKAGRELRERLLPISGIKDPYITNIVKCRPPGNRDPKPHEIEKCTGLHFMPELNGGRPRVIVAAGLVATRTLLSMSIDPPKKLPTMDVVHGFSYGVTIGDLDFVLVPSYHPAAGLRDPKVMEILVRDWTSMRRTSTPTRTGDDAYGMGMGEVMDLYPEPYYTSDWRKYNKEYGDTLEVLKVLALDTETYQSGSPFSLQMSFLPGTAVIVYADDVEGLQWSKSIVEGDYTCVIHNTMFDLPILEKLGIYPRRPFDTMIGAYLLQTHPQGLKALAYRIAGMDMQEFDEMAGDYSHPLCSSIIDLCSHLPLPKPIASRIRRMITDMDRGRKVHMYDRWKVIRSLEGGEALPDLPLPGIEHAPEDKALHYACRDADATLRIYPTILEELEDWGLLQTFNTDMAVVPVVLDMMRRGIGIDPEAFKILGQVFAMDLARIQREIVVSGAAPEFNPVSSAQTQILLFDDLGLSTKYGRSSSDKVLARIAGEHPVVPLIQEYREYHRLITAYCNALPKAAVDGRIHPTIRVTRTDTGRLSCTSPNLMAIPVRSKEGRLIRDGFVASPGCVFASFDYSQIEMRVVAHISGDAAMSNIFHTGADIHSQTASAMFGVPIGELDEMAHRYPAKRVGFGILNLISPQGLQREMVVGGARESDWPLAKCSELLSSWFGIYSGVRRFMYETEVHARRFGWVKDMWGRIRYVPGVHSPIKHLSEEAVRQACNAPIQMGAQGIIKQAMAKIRPLYLQFQDMGYTFYPLIQIHDDLVFEISESILDTVVPMIKEVMEKAVTLSVPVKVDGKVGKRWGSMIKI